MSLNAQAVILGRLHLARALVVAMAMAQHCVENSCHTSRARSKRSAVGAQTKLCVSPPLSFSLHLPLAPASYQPGLGVQKALQGLLSIYH